LSPDTVVKLEKIVQTKTSCEEHSLHAAMCPTASRDGCFIYVVCGCGKARKLPLPVWEVEVRRRQAVKQVLAPYTEGLWTSQDGSTER